MDYLDIFRNYKDKDMMSCKSLGDNDINITDSIWNGIIKQLSVDAKVIFWGFRLEFDNNNIKNQVRFISRDAFEPIELNPLSFEIDIVAFTQYRNIVQSIWQCYEYPALVFLKDEANVNVVLNYIKEGYKIDKLIKLSSIYILYKSFEYNVLWLHKSKNLDFPYI